MKSSISGTFYMPPSKPATRPPAPYEVPRFALYGESAPGGDAEFVHVELIETRSRAHDWHIDRHTHPGLFQVLFLLGGEVSAAIQDELWTCSGPLAITVHPSVVHGFDFSTNAHGYVLTVDQNVLFASPDHRGDLFAPLFVQPSRLVLEAPPRARIEALLENLIEETAWPQRSHTLMLEWLARAVLLLLVRVQADQTAAHASGHSEFELFSRFRAAVEERYRSAASVADYARLLKVSPVRLNRLCLRLADKSAFDLVQDRLMLEACRKLTYAPSSVASVAYELGFQDPAYFSRAFRKRMGISPKEFRRRGS
jgi:AraC family transcriptional activator of pobA